MVASPESYFTGTPVIAGAPANEAPPAEQEGQNPPLQATPLSDAAPELRITGTAIVDRAPAKEEPAAAQEDQNLAPSPGTSYGATATQPPITPGLSTSLPVENRLVELEWPQKMRLGDSDIIRLALVPYQEGYIVQAEFPEHQVQSQNLQVVQLEGYTLTAIARLDGVNFDIQPAVTSASTS